MCSDTEHRRHFKLNKLCHTFVLETILKCYFSISDWLDQPFLSVNAIFKNNINNMLCFCWFQEISMTDLIKHLELKGIPFIKSLYGGTGTHPAGAGDFFTKLAVVSKHVSRNVHFKVSF